MTHVPRPAAPAALAPTAHALRRALERNGLGVQTLARMLEPTKRPPPRTPEREEWDKRVRNRRRLLQKRLNSTDPEAGMTERLARQAAGLLDGVEWEDLAAPKFTPDGKKKREAARLRERLAELDV